MRTEPVVAVHGRILPRLTRYSNKVSHNRTTARLLYTGASSYCVREQTSSTLPSDVGLIKSSTAL
jgi:hypothetical protein